MAKKARFVLRRYSEEPQSTEEKQAEQAITSDKAEKPKPITSGNGESLMTAMGKKETSSSEVDLSAVLQALSSKQEKKLDKQKQVVALRLSPETVTKAKALGKGYTGVLARMLDYCLEDPEIIKKCL